MNYNDTQDTTGKYEIMNRPKTKKNDIKTAPATDIHPEANIEHLMHPNARPKKDNQTTRTNHIWQSKNTHTNHDI
jgi:hypothetical protein